MTEQEKRIADFFDVGELAEYLGLTPTDLIYAFSVELEEALDDLEELMQVKRNDKRTTK